MTRAERARRGRARKVSDRRNRQPIVQPAKTMSRFSRQVVRRHAHAILVRGSKLAGSARGLGVPKPKRQREETLQKTILYPKGQIHHSPHTKPPLSQRRDTRRRANRVARRARRVGR